MNRGDTVTGWFGTGTITDIGDGFLIDRETGEQLTPEDDLVRIEQNGKGRYIYRDDIDAVVV